MLALEFVCQGRELTYGPGVHDELSEIAKGVKENTGAEIEHWKRDGDKYTLYFITNKLIDLVWSKGASGEDMILHSSRVLYFTALYGLRRVRFYKVDLEG